MVLIWEHLSELSDVAVQVLDFAQSCPLWLLEGDLGVGKTALLKEIGKICCIKESITSPTFSLINAYIDDNANHYFHFDFYRLKNIEEVFDLGFDDYLEQAKYCFVEWASRIDLDFFPRPYLLIDIKIIMLSNLKKQHKLTLRKIFD